MRVLAEFIMRGRMQAGLVVFFGNLVPFVSPAAVSLTTLTKGFSESVLLLSLALMPLLIALYVSDDANAILTLLSITSILCVWSASRFMKLRSSWSEVLIFVVIFSTVATILISVLFNEKLLALEGLIEEFFKEALQDENKPIVSTSFLLGVSGYVIALTSVIALVLGRWWQSMLYNPGGFKLEFHQLRFSVTTSIIILIGILFSEVVLHDYSSWSSLLSLPLMLSGIALLHYSVAFFQLGSYWLVVFYLALLFLSPMSIMLVGMGVLDSIFNIRSRLSMHS